ncbi:MAG: hypothetical protein GFH27_549289n352 [Chloroflexi bacterium AL-W]|nr:hypothetical protein [Chloroflexi bacterium AL-N1]NOK67084.1 hypothetical protein [Chloroflexi bacterium AL-N10]NOK74623.1 hypothetical protein [Chloroflexi bacterium AL-N5]NOK81686.1 hypothetical protein [Chloroflexi bacterium AL-W]NOK89156.1 hypothetical protein [Chloroflexi bacterium AL-N15]
MPKLNSNRRNFLKLTGIAVSLGAIAAVPTLNAQKQEQDLVEGDTTSIELWLLKSGQNHIDSDLYQITQQFINE